MKLTLSFRGREMSHTEIGFETIRRAIADLETMGHADNQPRLVGRNISVMMTPLPANRRKPKFLKPEDHDEDHEERENHGDFDIQDEHSKEGEVEEASIKEGEGSE